MRKPKPDAIAREITRDIHAGRIAAGAPLIQEELARRFGVSRIPIREALKQLESENVVTVRAGEGTFVSVPTVDEVAEIFEIRLQLEPYLLRASVPRLGPRDFETAGRLLRDLDLPPEGALRSDLDRAFHNALYAGAERPLHIALIGNLRTRLAPLYAGPGRSIIRSGTALREHEALLAAARSGDERDASSLLVRHLIRARDALHDALVDDPQSVELDMQF